MHGPAYAAARQLRVERAVQLFGLRWVGPQPPSTSIYEIVGDELQIFGRLTLDGFASFEIEERVDLTRSPDPLWYQYGLSFIDGGGHHQRREVHDHGFMRGPSDQCSPPCHRHRYVGLSGGSRRPHLGPCNCVSIEDALAELLADYYAGYPPSRPPNLRP